MGETNLRPMRPLTSRPLERIDGESGRQLLREGTPWRAVLVGWYRRPWSGPSPRSLSILGRCHLSKSHPCDDEAGRLNPSDVVRQPCTLSRHFKTALMARSLGCFNTLWPSRFGGLVRQNRRRLPYLVAKVRSASWQALVRWNPCDSTSRRSQQIFCSFRLRNVLGLRP
jgi:hypothetical protein